MNLASLSIDYFAHKIEVIRKASGEYDTAGDWVADGLDEKITTQGVVQPLSGEVLKSLEEGLRELATHTVWSKFILSLDDVILHKGARYRVMKSRDWEEFGGYYRAITEKLED